MFSCPGTRAANADCNGIDGVGILGYKGGLRCEGLNSFLQGFVTDFCADIYNPTALIFELLVCLATLMCLLELTQK
eukprot:m.1662921 g.1662921  ORF g.1662921 m.1662921 type:complete len:76 (-) comp133026_c0_seq1:130-357(-)